MTISSASVRAITTARRHLLVIGTLVLTAYFGIATAVVAQPAWVKASMQQAENLSIPRDVPALVLTNQAEVVINSTGTATWHKRYAVKILTGAGVSSADLDERVNEKIKVSNLKGWLVTTSGCQQLSKSQVIEIASSNAAGYYNEDRVVTAAFPGVVSGDVVAYEYDVEERSSTADNCQWFVFQADLPVNQTSLVVTVPGSWQLRWSEQLLEGITSLIDRNIYRWTAGYLAPRLAEPYMSPWPYSYRRIAFMAVPQEPAASKSVPQWQPAARSAWLMLDSAAVADETVRQFAQQLTQGKSDSAAMVRAVCDFVRQSIRYVAVEIGPGRFQPRRAAVTLTNRYGDCKDKVALARALLASVGIPSWPVLASVGRPVMVDLATPFQFNHCILALPAKYLGDSVSTDEVARSGVAFFDPTDETLPLGKLSTSLSGESVLVASPKDSELTLLPSLRSDVFRSLYAAQLTLGPSGQFSGRVTITSFGNMSLQVARALQSSSATDQLDELRQWLGGILGSVTLSDYSWQSGGDSTVQSFRLSGERVLMEAGDRRLLKLDIFEGDRSERLDTLHRIHPLYCGSPRTVETSVEWTIPEGWQTTDGPRAIDHTTALTRFSSQVHIDDRAVKLHRTETYLGGTLPASQAGVMQAWLSQRNAASGVRLMLTPK